LLYEIRVGGSQRVFRVADTQFLLLPGLDLGQLPNRSYRREEVKKVFYYDVDFYRQRYEEKMAEMRRDYQRPPQRRQNVFAPWMQYVSSVWSRPRWRRAPVYRP
jgi:hypothetical protein